MILFYCGEKQQKENKERNTPTFFTPTLFHFIAGIKMNLRMINLSKLWGTIKIKRLEMQPKGWWHKTGILLFFPRGRNNFSLSCSACFKWKLTWKYSKPSVFLVAKETSNRASAEGGRGEQLRMIQGREAGWWCCWLQVSGFALYNADLYNSYAKGLSEPAYSKFVHNFPNQPFWLLPHCKLNLLWKCQL